MWRFLSWSAKFPFYIRWIFGLLLMAGGLIGFLPILGFWMIPLGMLVIGTTLPVVSSRIRTWMDRVAREQNLTHPSAVSNQYPPSFKDRT